MFVSLTWFMLWILTINSVIKRLWCTGGTCGMFPEKMKSQIRWDHPEQKTILELSSVSMETGSSSH